jgi:hypothetical protein
MYVYLQTYQQEGEAALPVAGFVTFYRGQTKVFETPALMASEAQANRLKTMPLQFRFSLANLSPGEYNCQVTVLRPGGSKASFWQTSVMIIP